MSEADQIRELAERFLSHPGPAGDIAVRLTVGKLPNGFDLPMPTGARLIGSLVREPGYNTDRDIEIILDAPGSEDDLLEFMEPGRGKHLRPDCLEQVVPGKDEQIGYLFVVQGPGENDRSLWVRTDATRRSGISL